MELHKDVLNIIEENMEFYNTDNLIDNNFEFIIWRDVDQGDYKIHNYFLNNSKERMTHELVHNCPTEFFSLIVPCEYLPRGELLEKIKAMIKRQIYKIILTKNNYF